MKGGVTMKDIILRTERLTPKKTLQLGMDEIPLTKLFTVKLSGL